MRFPTKLLLTLCGAALVFGAIPLFSDADEIPSISGTWAGEGKGYACPPGTKLFGWQKWKGEVTNDQMTFHGEWVDKLGHWGKFKGQIWWISITQAVAVGTWTWENNPTGYTLKAGDFKMNFSIFSKKCEGTWTSIYLSPQAYGKMWGKKVNG